MDLMILETQNHLNKTAALFKFYRSTSSTDPNTTPGHLSHSNNQSMYSLDLSVHRRRGWWWCVRAFGLLVMAVLYMREALGHFPFLNFLISRLPHHPGFSLLELFFFKKKKHHTDGFQSIPSSSCVRSLPSKAHLQYVPWFIGSSDSQVQSPQSSSTLFPPPIQQASQKPTTDFTSSRV